jgi:hypothetical protein
MAHEPLYSLDDDHGLPFPPVAHGAFATRSRHADHYAAERDAMDARLAAAGVTRAEVRAAMDDLHTTNVAFAIKWARVLKTTHAA